ncbi:MAG TPA: tetratricopeptide repeat protein [Burkholderiales bacterium]|nr:tetratricopeptide repeat protein [Burkholderiales bacterium]
MKSFLSRFSRSAAPLSHTPAAPEALEALITEGNSCEDRGEYATARELYQRAVAMSPHSARAHMNLGNALAGLGNAPEALECYRRAIVLQPQWLPAQLNLGALLLAAGDLAAAESAYRCALEIAPESASAWTGLGCALDTHSDEAEVAFRMALALTPGHAGTASRLAHRLREQGHAREAIHELRSALLANPDDALLLRTLGEILAGVGEPEEACAAYRRALATTPDDWNVWGMLLWALNFVPEAGAGQILAEHRRFGDAMARAVGPTLDTPVRHEHRRLKVGYVSADFRRHSVACFIEPLLRHHDRARFEVHCFYNYSGGDEVTQRLFELAEHWHDIAGMDDADVARRIHDNGIDILVDLAGHTSHNRLGVFARKPAPVQITWLGYLCTTGLQAVDYRLCDARTDPPGLAETWQVETPLRLPDSQWCYSPQVELPLPTSLPRLANGHWTFGSFNQESKLNTPTLRAWASILLTVPDSRLRVLGITCDLVEERIRGVFVEQGVAVERIDILGRVPIEAYLSAFGDVDVALDTFPYNGATTTCDALLMGVPVATVAGERAIARGGVSLLSTMGLGDWIAASPEVLADTVSAHLRDPKRLAELRRELPGRMRASPLMDGAAFAKNVEAIFAQVWRAN